VSDHIPDATKMISDTPRTDDAEYLSFDSEPPQSLEMVDVAFARQLERELNAANAIIKQQQLLDEENLRLKERIKRLDETLEAVTDKLDGAWGIYMKFKEAKP
jgi:archaellum component FlaC